MGLKQNLPGIKMKEEFVVKFYDNLWFTRRMGGDFETENSCKLLPNAIFTGKPVLCVAGLPMVCNKSVRVITPRKNLSSRIDMT